MTRIVDQSPPSILLPDARVFGAKPDGAGGFDQAVLDLAQIRRVSNYFGFAWKTSNQSFSSGFPAYVTWDGYEERGGTFFDFGTLPYGIFVPIIGRWWILGTIWWATQGATNGSNGTRRLAIEDQSLVTHKSQRIQAATVDEITQFSFMLDHPGGGRFHLYAEQTSGSPQNMLGTSSAGFQNLLTTWVAIVRLDDGMVEL